MLLECSICIKYSLISVWSLLGFHRGMKSYDYTINKEKQFYNNKYTYFYSNRFLYGMLGFGIYINPFFLLITIPKEIYRLEVDLRGLEDESKTNYYNYLLY